MCLSSARCALQADSPLEILQAFSQELLNNPKKIPGHLTKIFTAASFGAISMHLIFMP